MKLRQEDNKRKVNEDMRERSSNKINKTHEDKATQYQVSS